MANSFFILHRSLLLLLLVLVRRVLVVFVELRRVQLPQPISQDAPLPKDETGPQPVRLT
jgi:hypothetical protein